MKIFIADDSISYRSQIEKQLSLYPQVEVVGSSRISPTTLSIVLNAKPDLIILDLHEELGFDLLAQIRNTMPKDVKLVGLLSSPDQGQRAKSLGCREIVRKATGLGERDNSDSVRVAKELVEIALRIDGGVMVERAEPLKRIRTGMETFEPNVIVIASSTGGPPILERIFSVLRPELRIPILIAQHMPEGFTKDLAERLASVSQCQVREAVDGEEVKAGTVYVAPGNFHMRLVNDGRKIAISLDQGDKLHSVRPAADYLFNTAATIYGNSCMGFILTGMGNDGAIGAQTVKKLGGKIMLQDKETAAVWGMPGAAHSLGAFDSMGPTDLIASTIGKMAMRRTA